MSRFLTLQDKAAAEELIDRLLSESSSVGGERRNSFAITFASGKLEAAAHTLPAVRGSILQADILQYRITSLRILPTRI